jgi:hypothetical protein
MASDRWLMLLARSNHSCESKRKYLSDHRRIFIFLFCNRHPVGDKKNAPSRPPTSSLGSLWKWKKHATYPSDPWSGLALVLNAIAIFVPSYQEYSPLLTNRRTHQNEYSPLVTNRRTHSRNILHF